MKFYCAWYKIQKYSKEEEVWKYWDYGHKVIVLAENYFEAMLKIEECLLMIKEDDYRAVLDSNIQECIGLNVEHGYDQTYITPLVKE